MATAFAIFCANDGSLTFYKRDTVPSVGDTFEGKVVSNVYEGFETKSYFSSTSIPWADNMAAIVSVSFVDEISPKYTRNWFYNASVMTSFDGANLNTSNVSDMSSMFYECKNLTSLDLSSFNTSKVTSMGTMFRACSSLTTLDLSNFNTTNVTNMSVMFSGCSSLTSLDLSNFNTTNVTNMSVMFYNCSSLTSLDLSNFNTSKVTNMRTMFNNCTGLSTIYVSDLWTTAAVTNSTNMFSGCTSLVGAIPYDSAVTDATHANYQTGYLTYKRFVIPEDMLILNTTLYDLADKIRVLSAKNDSMNPIQMTEVLAGILDAKEVLF